MRRTKTAHGFWLVLKRESDIHECKPPFFTFRVAVGSIWECGTCHKLWEVRWFEGKYWGVKNQQSVSLESTSYSYSTTIGDTVFYNSVSNDAKPFSRDVDE